MNGRLGLLAAAAVGFTLTAHALSLQPPQVVFPEVGENPVGAAVGDINGDGHADLAVSFELTNDIALLFGDGSGRFVPAPGDTYPKLDSPYSPILADLNADGDLDLVAVSFQSGELLVALGDGAGAFEEPAGERPQTGPTISVIVVGDLDGDDIPDLAAADQTGTVHLLLGQGDGRFLPAAGVQAGTELSFRHIAVGDVTGDGVADIAVAQLRNGAVYLFEGSGDGIFEPFPDNPFQAGGTAWSVAIADFNGDELGDVATADRGAGELSILLSTGQGLDDGSRSTISLGTSGQIVAGDANQDGFQDLLAIASDAIFLLEGDGKGGFGERRLSLVGATRLALADVNGDSRPDIVTANAGPESASVALGPEFDPAPGSPLQFGRNPSEPVFGFLDQHDGLDIAMLLREPEQLLVLGGKGNGRFARASMIADLPQGVFAGHLAAGDFTGDGRQELVVSLSGDVAPQLAIFARRQSAQFEIIDSVPIPTGPSAVTVGDLDGDGLDDIVSSAFGTGLRLLLSQGDGTFIPAADSPIETPASADVIIADLNDDDLPDLVLSDGTTSSVLVFLGDGAGAFEAAAGSPVSIGSGIGRLAVGDLNGDGFPDLAAGNISGFLYVALGDGTGGFTPLGPAYGSGIFNLFGLLLIDANRDGHIDAVAAGQRGPGAIVVLPGNGTGELGAPITLPADGRLASLGVGDLDGDQRPDVAALTRIGTEDIVTLTSDAIFNAGDFEPTEIELGQ